ncbi:MAG: IS5 family transposase [Candidatus Dormiibacterota bacterium]
MRGSTAGQEAFLMSLTPDQLVPQDHPIRRIRAIVEKALAALSADFDAMYARNGRPSIPPERLLKGSLLIALYSIRSERQFCERLRYDMLFKWFLDMGMDEEPFDPTSFTKNRDRLLKHEVAARFFAAVRGEAERRRLISDEHFTVDGTLLEAWASIKSFTPREEGEVKGGPPAPSGRNPEVNFRGERRSNETHVSTTDPEARLARKGKVTTAKLSYTGHVLMENRNGLVVEVELTQATGYAEREAGLELLRRHRRHRGESGRWTLGADKGYDTTEFVTGCRGLEVTPHVACNTGGGRGSRIDQRTTRHEGYLVSQRKRKRVEEIFGWVKTVGGGRKLRYIGVTKNAMWAMLTATAYNLVRMAKLELAAA